MDLAEDRGAFSDLLKELDIPYPEYGAATNVDEAVEIAKRVGFPVLVRPSYVLGGQKMLGKTVVCFGRAKNAYRN